MPTWGEILAEFQDPTNQLPNGMPDWDGVRRKYLAQLATLTGRRTILCYTDWFGKGGPVTSITLEDMQAMMEVCKGLRGPALDLILHSPGGSPEATASIVRYLRRKFDDIRVFVPLAAMSAATMLGARGQRDRHGQALAARADRPTTGLRHGVDASSGDHPAVRAREGRVSGPVAARCLGTDPAAVRAGAHRACEAAETLARRLVREWLELYMFGGEDDAGEKAETVASYFANYEIHQSHSLGIDRDQAAAQGVKMAELETDPELQDAVLSVHHSVVHTFTGAAAKIVENHEGHAYVKLAQQVVIQIPMVGPGLGAGPGMVPPSLPGP